ncbi:MAG: hypothetical protein ACQ9ET_00235 [Nitrosomonadaceae bacterium]
MADIKFIKESNGNVTVTVDDVVAKCLQPDLNVLCDEQQATVLIISSSPNPYDELDEFKFPWASVTLPVHTDKADLIGKLCADFFDGTHPITIDTSGLATEPKQDVGNASLASILAKIIAAPSTEAKQDTIITGIASLLAELDLKANLTETQPVSAASLPLPSGASTEATLVSVLAKIIAAPSTEAKQDVVIAALGLLIINEKLLQVDSVGSTTYLGYADPGTLTSDATWAVKRIIETAGDASITWADGDNSFDNIWDDRLTLIYA